VFEDYDVFWHVDLILFCIQEHYRLVNGVSEDEANLVFNNAAWKVIKDAFKHARCISVASYYTQVNLLSIFNYCFVVIDFWLWYLNVILFCILVLKREMKPTQVNGIYLTKEQHLQGGRLVG
jgi:hypothetical protein